MVSVDIPDSGDGAAPAAAEAAAENRAAPIPPLAAEAADKFSEYERFYLLQYIYFGDVRGVALIAALATVMVYYLLQNHDALALFNYRDAHRILQNLGLLSGLVSLGATGIALCPFPPIPARLRRLFWFISRRPGHGRKDKTIVTHYNDIADFPSGSDYADKVIALAMDQSHKALIHEKLRECFELARIVKDKMNWIIAGFLLAAMSAGFLFADLAWFPPQPKPTEVQQDRSPPAPLLPLAPPEAKAPVVPEPQDPTPARAPDPE